MPKITDRYNRSRVQADVPLELRQRVEDYMWRHRMSLSEAVRDLLEKGLASEQTSS